MGNISVVNRHYLTNSISYHCLPMNSAGIDVNVHRDKLERGEAIYRRLGMAFEKDSVSTAGHLVYMTADTVNS
jgi:hypothetical protein